MQLSTVQYQTSLQYTTLHSHHHVQSTS